MSTEIDWPAAMTMQMSAEYNAPFWENEDADITAYGHWDRDKLIEKIREYDQYLSGEEPIGDYSDANLQMRYRWVVPEGDLEDETLRLRYVDEGTAGAFAVTTVVRF
jgi:hypothetical protein